MSVLLRVPHGFLRRHLSMAERGLVAAGLALALYGLLTGLPVYPTPWEIVLSAAVFLVMLWSPPLAYFLAVTAALYPLYTVSVYLAVLFLAVALLGQRVFIHNMGAALLVLAAPWLAQYHLEWLVVLLGGLWWGKSGGAWMGGLAALWGQLFFGMTGQSPNWLDMMGIAPAAQSLFAQFQNASSLDTLRLIVTPLGPNPTLLLYHLLEIVLWAMIAGLVGGLAETNWVQQEHPWRAIAIAIPGAAALALANAGLAYWLNLYKVEDFAWIIPGLLESALYAAVASAGLEGARDVIENPLALRRPASRREAARGRAAPPEPAVGYAAEAQPPTRFSLIKRLVAHLRPSRRLRQQQMGQAAINVKAASPDTAAPASGTPGTDDAPYQPIPVPPNLPHRDSKKQPPDDIIKIELD